MFEFSCFNETELFNITNEIVKAVFLSHFKVKMKLKKYIEFNPNAKDKEMILSYLEE